MCVDAVHSELPKSVHSCWNYSLPKLACFFETQCSYHRCQFKLFIWHTKSWKMTIAGIEDATATPDPKDMLDRDKCVQLLAELRHAKWFQVVCCDYSSPRYTVVTRLCIRPWPELPPSATLAAQTLSKSNNIQLMLVCLPSSAFLEMPLSLSSGFDQAADKQAGEVHCKKRVGCMSGRVSSL